MPSLPELINKIKPSVVRVVFQGGSSGSGFIVDKDGYVVTNAHAVKESKSARIELSDGRSLGGDVIVALDRADLAVVKVAPPQDLTAAPLGDSDLIKDGAQVFALGFPPGESTAVEGTVSARRGELEELDMENFQIHVDADGNPGNIGGPLFDMSGNVIGMNTPGNHSWQTGMFSESPFGGILAEIDARAKSDQHKGAMFERLTKRFFEDAAAWRDCFEKIWLWAEWPQRGGRPDAGIDLVAKNADGDGYTAIQAKFYPRSRITKAHVDSFISNSGVSVSGGPSFTRRIFVSIDAGWTKNAKETCEQQTPVERLGADDLESSSIDWDRFDVSEIGAKAAVGDMIRFSISITSNEVVKRLGEYLPNVFAPKRSANVKTEPAPVIMKEPMPVTSLMGLFGNPATSPASSDEKPAENTQLPFLSVQRRMEL